MYLRSLKVKDFRVYSEAFFEFSPETNLICGPNAIGKTSILEAVYFLMTGRSFRTSVLTDMVKKGESGFQVEATFVKHDVEQTLQIAIAGKKRHILHNETHYSSLSSLFGLMQGVVISPDDASLVKGAPALRRRFLDMHIAQLDPHYVRHLSRYYRAMKQRNFLLKESAIDTIESWEEQMALSAVYIIQQRLLAVSELQECIFNLHRNLTGEAQDLIIQYEGITHSRESLLEQYKKLRPREAIVGSTLTGPHRDDFQLIIGSNDTRRFASEGQQRSCVAALMFAKWERVKKIAGLAPMMLIDDVGMSLDRDRCDKFFSHLTDLSQVILTSTSEAIPHGYRVDLPNGVTMKQGLF